MAECIHEVWLQFDEEGNKLHSCVRAGSINDEFRTIIQSEGAHHIWSFKASSHFEAMTHYYHVLYGEIYTSINEDDKKPYSN